MAARMTRTGRVRTIPPMTSLVRQVFELGCKLAHPAAIVEPPDEATVALVSCHVQKLLLSDQRPKPREVRIGAVAHDPADHPGELAPLALGQRLAVAGDGHQQRCGRARDRVGEQLFGLGACDDLAAGADDVGDPITANADDVAATADSGAFEVARACFHRDSILEARAGAAEERWAPPRR